MAQWVGKYTQKLDMRRIVLYVALVTKAAPDPQARRSVITVRVASAAKSMLQDERGVSSVEYAMLLAVLSLAAVIAFGQCSGEVQLVVTRGSRALERAAGMGCAPTY
jgi:Flp pilus assembly pilin Flp